MEKNSVIYEEYPTSMSIDIPAKWMLVAEDYLNENQFKEWLFLTVQYLGFCGMEKTGDVQIDTLLDAIYDEEESFFDQYCNSLFKKRMPIEDRLKVSRMWSKEEQLDAYLNRQGK